jgi:predicted lipid carrier protein YhbT
MSHLRDTVTARVRGVRSGRTTAPGTGRIRMATVDECRTALHNLAARLAANAASSRERLSLDRTLACTIKDLGVSFRARLLDGQLVEIADGDDAKAKIRLTTTGDDLVALVAGQLDFAKAWASGRLSVNANPFDLLKLRKLL